MEREREECQVNLVQHLLRGSKHQYSMKDAYSVAKDCKICKTHETTADCRYYEASGEDNNTLATFMETNPSIPKKDRSTKQSRQLPHWLWFVIAKCLGIPLHPNDKPIIGLILHMLTFASALTFAVSHMWFVIFDILSPNTPIDIANGTVSIFLIVCWGSFGFYAKNLSARLFRHTQFLRDIRMHSRTIFKINAAVLFFLLGAIFISTNDYDGFHSYLNETCEKVELYVIVCKLQFLSRVIFSVFALIWHSLVSFVLISVCRTHTIGIRRFIRELEYDAAMYEHYFAQTNMDVPLKYEDICQETSWLEGDMNTDDEMLSTDEPFSILNHRRFTKSKRRYTCPPTFDSASFSNNNRQEGDTNRIETVDEIGILTSPIQNHEDEFARNNHADHDQQDKSNTRAAHSERQFIPISEMNKGTSIIENSDDCMLTPHTMSVTEILHNYWKIYCRLRLSSAALQRWFVSFISLVILWCATYLVYWLKNPASASDIVQFMVPLIILILLSSALAEVNMEGQRMTRCICPTEERLKLLQFLSQSPLVMPMYGFPMTHGTIITVIFAILVGFTSRIIITEMTK
ncbi:uncharacterized protein LOC111619963 [Centruroides sculpturatus]|uniref:uncharacterized protein LOC111619963 n=1 Tax=Centruroides sculpturatus TaxID=218467 RepID=UPI000C6CE5E4|nr:uncharacterized protein LOC111619963 [Centruroides sculpturatus]